MPQKALKRLKEPQNASEILKEPQRASITSSLELLLPTKIYQYMKVANDLIGTERLRTVRTPFNHAVGRF